MENIPQKIREIAFVDVLNFFPVQNMIFGHFCNGQKWILVKKFLVKLIYLISRVFLAWTFFIFWPTVQALRSEIKVQK